MAESLPFMVAVILSAGGNETAEMLLATVGWVLGAALLVGLSVLLLYVVLKPLGEHQQAIYGSLESLGLERKEQGEPAVVVYEGSVDGVSMVVAFQRVAGLPAARLAVLLRRPLNMGLRIVRRPGPSWPRGTMLTWEQFEHYFEATADDADRAGKLLDSGKIRLAAARILEAEQVVAAVIQDELIEVRTLYRHKTDPEFLSGIIRMALALEGLLYAYSESKTPLSTVPA